MRAVLVIAILNYGIRIVGCQEYVDILCILAGYEYYKAMKVLKHCMVRSSGENSVCVYTRTVGSLVLAVSLPKYSYDLFIYLFTCYF